MMIFGAVYLAIATYFCPWRYRAANFLDTQVHLSIVILASLMLWFANRSDLESSDLSIMAVIMSCMPFLFAAVIGFVLVFPNLSQTINPNSDNDKIRVLSMGFSAAQNGVLGAGICSADKPCNPDRVSSFADSLNFYITFEEQASACVDFSAVYQKQRTA